MQVLFGYEKGRQTLDRSRSRNIIDERLESGVRDTINRVRLEGDEALKELTLEYDKVDIQDIEVDASQITQARKHLDSGLLEALEYAGGRIFDYHRQQKTGIDIGIGLMNGSQLLRPLERVGVYAPGGRAFYPSTVLMTAIPAKAAGVENICLATPPGPGGKIPTATLAAASIAGVDRVFAMGGAQAIAAFAYGTESVPRVDKICGPGNRFVTAAKKLVFGEVAIDGLQGPSEVLIIADNDSNSRFCATDMLAQAEHDPDAASVLVTTSEELARKVIGDIKELTRLSNRQEIIMQSLNDNGKIVVVDNIDEAIDLANIYAPEHLCILSAKATDRLSDINNAGCVFIGEKATVAVGDYVAGPSHALPTSGTARFSSPLNVLDFVKIIDVVNVTEAMIQQSGKFAVTIAEAEGLTSHASAIKARN